MKVCLANTNSSLTGSGASWSYLYLILGLIKRGVDVFAVLPGHGDLEETLKQNGVKCYIIKEYPYGLWLRKLENNDNVVNSLKNVIKYFINLKSEYDLQRIFEKEKPDIVHINAITGYLCAKAAKRMNIKYIWHIRELLREFIGAEFSNPEFARNLMKNASKMIAVSDACRNEYLSFAKYDNVTTIYNGVAPKNFYTEREILSGKVITIIQIGVVFPQKGQLDLVKAIALLPPKYKERIKCIFAGKIRDEEYHKQILEIIKTNNLKDKIEMIGYKPNVYEYVKQADISCLCSANEPFGRVTIEGMFAKCLVIGANSAGTAEIIDDKVTGLLYSPNDIRDLESKIEWVLDNIDTARSIAENGQNKAINLFTDDVNANKIIAVYNDVLYK